MKKFNKLNLLVIGFSLLLVCAFLSYVGKKLLNVDGDYLSAAATLFTGFIAALLYSDWKAQHKVQLLDKYHNELKKQIEKLNKSRKLISEEFFAFIASTNKYLSYDSPLANLESTIKEEYQSTGRLLNEYLIYLNTLSDERFINNHKEQVQKLLARVLDISKDFIKIREEFDLGKQFQELVKSLNSGEQYKFILELEIFSEFALSPFYFEFFNAQN
ncbi:hypothetical protein [Acinetobacter pittii]|uniref:hypothetical protein n=1 Tax=Acinetobacter pittii TaxID=48296 RepID=UPI0036F47E74